MGAPVPTLVREARELAMALMLRCQAEPDHTRYLRLFLVWCRAYARWSRRLDARERATEEAA